MPTAEPHITGIESLGFSHTLLRLEAELAWHEECLKTLPLIFARSAGELALGLAA